MKTLKVHVEFFEEMLALQPGDPNIYSNFIASKAPDAESREEEIAAIGAYEYEDKNMSVFARDDKGRAYLYDYHWKGFFKDTCGALRYADGYKSEKMPAYKKRIDGLVFVSPRKIPLILPKRGLIGCCQRPLRTSSPKGEFQSLKSSESVPEGTTQDFEITILKDSLLPLVIEWLDYGKLRGTGEWRNSGKGRFYFTAVDSDGEVYSNMPE